MKPDTRTVPILFRKKAQIGPIFPRVTRDGVIALHREFKKREAHSTEQQQLACPGLLGCLGQPCPHTTPTHAQFHTPCSADEHTSASAHIHATRAHHAHAIRRHQIEVSETRRASSRSRWSISAYL